jgi:hypothetical protein
MNLEHETKVGKCDEMLNQLIDQVKEDFLYNGGFESREKIEQKIQRKAK